MLVVNILLIHIPRLNDRNVFALASSGSVAGYRLGPSCVNKDVNGERYNPANKRCCTETLTLNFLSFNGIGYKPDLVKYNIIRMMVDFFLPKLLLRRAINVYL